MYRNISANQVPLNFQSKCISFFFLDHKPTLHQLHVLMNKDGRKVKVIDSVAAKWEELAIALGFDAPDIDYVKRDYTQDAKGACRQVLYMWLNDESNENLPITWTTLVQCLKDAQFSSVAEDLEKVLKENFETHKSQ